MPRLEAFIMGSILVMSVLLMLSLVVLIKKRDYRYAFRYGSAIFTGILFAELGLAIPDTPHLFALLKKLSVLPLIITIYLTLPVVRRAWELLRGESGTS